MFRTFVSDSARLNKTPTRFVAIATALLALQGCGRVKPELADVAGVVLLDGQPLPDVMLEFQPTSGKGSPSVGYTDRQGRYRLRFTRDRWGAIPGTHRVRIDYDYEQGSDAPKPSLRIPPQYNKKSDLHRDLVPGKNTVSFELSSKDLVVRGGKPKAR